MLKNEQLHDFLLTRAEQLTEDWYEGLDKTGSGVYSNTDPKAIEKLKSQNFEFHRRLCKVFTLNQKDFYEQFEDWINDVGGDPQHLETDTHLIMREFFRTREQYLTFLNEYIESQSPMPGFEKVKQWRKAIVETIDTITMRVVEEKSKQLNQQIEDQQQTINELSSPLILLSEGRALLPLVGDINSERAHAIMENTLRGCTDKSIDHLFIDLSGVYQVDTVVAQQIFVLLKGLELIGVTCTLSGIRPEIAQMATKLGVDFGRVSITNTLATAFSKHPLYNK